MLASSEFTATRSRQRIPCHYRNMIPQLQATQVFTLPNWKFEPMVLTTEQLLFEAYLKQNYSFGQNT